MTVPVESGLDRERDAQGDAARRDSRSTITSILLLLGLLAALLITFLVADVLYHAIRDQQEERPTEPTVTVILRDTVWSGLNTTLVKPISIRAGATLRIVDSNVTVPLELLLWEERAWISVEPGGALELEGSTIQVTKGPSMDEAVVEDFWSSNEPPSLSRVVNLVDTQDPKLSFDIYWYNSSARLIVAVQPNETSPLVEESVFACAESDELEWQHFDVPLSRWKGTVPRVAIFPDVGIRRGLLVGNISVIDGGQGPKWDWFGTGLATEDGWECHSFVTVFDSSYESRYPWASVIDSRGDLSVVRSAVLAPAGANRDYLSGFDPGLGRPYGGIGSLTYVSCGVDIRATSTNVTVRRSTMRSMPLVASMTAIDIETSRFEGDAPSLSLLGCSGRIEGSYLGSVETPPDPPSAGSGGSMPWAVHLASCGSGAAFVVSGCTFSGWMNGIVIDSSSVSLTGCTFRDFGEGLFAVWDHNGSVPDNWKAISTTNSFVNCTGSLYFASHYTVVDFEGANKPSNPHGGSMGHEGFEYGGITAHPNAHDYFGDYMGITVIVPTVRVAGNGSIETLTNLTAEIDTDWGGEADLVLGPDDRSTTLFFKEHEFDPGHPEDWADLGQTVSTNLVPGEIEMTYSLESDFNGRFTYDAVTVLDGVVVNERRDREAQTVDYLFVLCQIPPGDHQIVTTFTGHTTDSASIGTIGVLTLSIIRILDSGENLTAGTSFGENGTIIIVDPFVDVDLGAIEIPWDGTARSIERAIFLGNGSIVEIDALVAPDVDGLQLRAEGNGSLVLRGANVTNWLTLSTGMTYLDKLTFTNSTVGSLSMEGLIFTVNLTDTESSYIWVSAIIESLNISHIESDWLDLGTSSSGSYPDIAPTVRIDNSTIEYFFSLENAFFDAVMTDVTINDITGQGGAYFDLSSGRSLDFSHCLIREAGWIYAIIGNDSDLRLEDCMFLANETCIQIECAVDFNPLTDHASISFNRNIFIGQPWRLVLPWFLIDDFESDNPLMDWSNVSASYGTIFVSDGTPINRGDMVLRLFIGTEPPHMNDYEGVYKSVRPHAILALDDSTHRPIILKDGWAQMIVQDETIGFIHFNPMDYRVDISEPSWEDIQEAVLAFLRTNHA